MVDETAPTRAPVVVFAHVHYPDIWEGMSMLLAERMEVPFRLVVTTPHPERDIALPATGRLVSSRVMATENRGRDIRPFLLALHEARDFEFGLKLHTKKSPQREDGALWRADVLDSLLPAPHDARGIMGGVGAIVARLSADERVGFVTPAGFCLSVAPWVLVNEAGMDRVMTTIGAPLRPGDLDDCFFAAGSMFWFRRPALAALAEQRVIELFEPETGQLDGTIAHAMERLFPVQARRSGMVSFAMPALAASRPGMDMGSLLGLARRHADVPSRYFPAPYVPAERLPHPVPSPPRLRTRIAWKLRRIVRGLLGRSGS